MSTEQETPAGTEPEGTMPQQVRIIRLLLEAAEGDKTVRADLWTNAGLVAASAGYPLQPADYAAFNEYARPLVEPTLEHLGRGGKLAELDGWECTVCKIGTWTLAVLIVAVGAAGVTFLTEGAAPVVALAAFAGVSAATSLAFIVGLVAAVGAGLDIVVTSICQWTKLCAATD
jgi:hypothetical protein